MKDNIYISTSAFKERKLEKILKICVENNIMNLELSSNIEYSDNNLELVYKYNLNPMHFLIHNYFPQPKEDFVLNLASDDKEILTKSIEHCKHAIDISKKLKAPFFSVHAGFAFHAKPEDLSNQQVQLPRIPYKKAYKIFVETTSELTDYAFKKNVKLAVENNVVADLNLEKGKNRILLLAEANEGLIFYKDISSPNFFYLIDIGHLKVSSSSLKFDINEYLKKMLPFTLGFHISENDSRSDQHLDFNDMDWFGNIIKENPRKIFILEPHRLNLVQIKKCYNSLERLLN